MVGDWILNVVENIQVELKLADKKITRKISQRLPLRRNRMTIPLDLGIGRFIAKIQNK